MKKSYDNSENFVDDLHLESLKHLTFVMGYLTEDDFQGSKVACVFHGDDNTPSLQVTDNFFKCYSCGAKGDIIKWVELSDNLNFIEALNFIAERLNIEFKTKSFSKYNGMKAKIEQEWKVYVDNMNNLMSRNDGLSNFVRSLLKDYFPLTLGYDPRTNYVVLPFTSKTGSILGFTKRRVDFPEERKIAKWMHSSIKDSLIEHCSNIFNLADSHIEISKSRTVYVEEGPKDVAAFKRAGITNTIAICGVSNFNEKILGILGPLDNIFMCFDGDDPGRKAMMNNIVTIASIDPLLAKAVRIIPLPDDEDPASISTDELKAQIEKSENGIEWLSRKGAEDDIVNLVSKASSSIIEEDVVRILNVRLGYHNIQSREWLNTRIRRIKTYSKKTEAKAITMKERLLATIGETDSIDIEPLDMTEDEARRVLKLRYNYK